MPQPPRPTKPCTVCGRDIQWRKKWERDWENVKYCSSACRRRGLTETDDQLEAAILTLLRARSHGLTICPSEVARHLAPSPDPAAWEPLMQPTRDAARRLVIKGLIDITQSGRVVDPSTAKGPIRLRLRPITSAR